MRSAGQSYPNADYPKRPAGRGAALGTEKRLRGLSALAAAYRNDDNTIFVLDQPVAPPARIRLLRMDADTGATSVVAVYPRIGAFDRYALAAAPDGSLVVAASGGASRQLLVVDLVVPRSAPPQALGIYSGRGVLNGILAADDRGVSVGIEDRALGFQMVGIRWRQMDRRSHIAMGVLF